MATKKKAVKYTNGSKAEASTKRKLIDRIENWLKSFGRYSYTLTLIVALFSVSGWILDRTIFRSRPDDPKISVYNLPAERVDPSIRSYFQFPAYKNLILEYGWHGSLIFENFYTLRLVKTGDDLYLMLRMEGEQDARTFNLTKMSVIPFTIQITNRGTKGLLTIEALTDVGVQIRTFREIK